MNEHRSHEITTMSSKNREYFLGKLLKTAVGSKVKGERNDVQRLAKSHFQEGGAAGAGRN
jgi:hypothetical protein